MHIILKIIFCICALALTITLAITPNLLPMGFHTDKMLHIFVFGLAATYITWQHLKTPKKTAVLLCVTLAAGIGIELIQTLVPNRTAQIEDIAANIIGITYGYITGYCLKTGIAVKINK